MTGISARVILDSMSPGHIRLTTVVATFPHMLFEDLIVHRELSYTPATRIREIRPDPLSMRTVLLTSTQWQTVIRRLLNTGPAGGSMTELAVRINDAIAISRPTVLIHTEWHLPFINDADADFATAHLLADYKALAFDSSCWGARGLRLLQMVSVARCLSPLRDLNNRSLKDFNQDLALFSRFSEHDANALITGSEHQATPDYADDRNWLNPHLHGNLTGWCQYRHVVVRELQAERIV